MATATADLEITRGIHSDSSFECFHLTKAAGLVSCEEVLVLLSQEQGLPRQDCYSSSQFEDMSQ